MEDREYEGRVDELFNAIEDRIDDLEADIDVDSSAGMLAIEFPNGSSVILSRQIVNHEVWVAAKSGGYHLAFIENQWLCQTSDENLSNLLGRVFTEQLGKSVTVFSL